MMQVDFFSKLASSNYDVFIVADNSAYCPKWKTHSVQYIKVEDSKCSSAGFKHLNPTVTRAKTVRQCSAWEKALYYFSRLEMSYDNVWFIEDDVLIPTTDTIRMIDSRHGKADIISASNNIDENPHIDSWYWFRHVPFDRLALPSAHSMVCAIRMSKSLLRIVSSFIAKNADFQNSEDAASRVHSAENHAPQPHYSADGSPLKYFFIEYLFHTLALHYKLKVVVAPELREILWIRKEKTQQIEEPFLYHPVKEIGLHDAYRRSKLITASRRDRGAAGKWVLPAYVPARPSRPSSVAERPAPSACLRAKTEAAISLAVDPSGI